MNLFSKPENGWVSITIGEVVIGASYITDVPMDFLNALISHMKYRVPLSVYVDEEGQEDIICMNENLIVISALHYTELISSKTIRVNSIVFIEDIIHGIEEYFDNWVNWFLDDDEEMTKNRAFELKSKLDEAKELFKAYVKADEEIEQENINVFVSKDNRVKIKLTKEYEQKDVGDYDFYASSGEKSYIGLFVYSTSEYGNLTDEQIVSNQVSILSETREMKVIKANQIQYLYDKTINTSEYLSNKKGFQDSIISLSTIRFKDVPDYVVLAIQTASKDEYNIFKEIMQNQLVYMEPNNDYDARL